MLNCSGNILNNKRRYFCIIQKNHIIFPTRLSCVLLSRAPKFTFKKLCRKKQQQTSGLKSAGRQIRKSPWQGFPVPSAMRWLTLDGLTRHLNQVHVWWRLHKMPGVAFHPNSLPTRLPSFEGIDDFCALLEPRSSGHYPQCPFGILDECDGMRSGHGSVSELH